MDTSEIAVLIGGILLITLILWYFFGAHEAPANASGDAKTNPRTNANHHH